MRRNLPYAAAIVLMAALLAACGGGGDSGATPPPDQPQSAPPPAGWELLWADEFDGDTLDPAKWNIQTGDGTAEGIPGWGNNELQTYRPGNVAVAGGNLVITARAESADGRSYTSGRINTRGKFELRYGRVEASIRTPAGQGMWSAFWLLPTNSPYGGWSASGEIDIMEVFSRQPAPFTQGAAHYGMIWPLNVYATKHYAGVDPSDGYHVHALEWDEQMLRWFVDGVHFHTVPNTTYWNYYKNPATNAHQHGPESAPFDQPFHLLLNLAVGGNLPGDPVPTALPAELLVDYVRVYRCSVDAETGLGCAGSADAVDPAVQPTAPDRVYQATYDLYRDAAGPLELSDAAVPLVIKIDDMGGAPAFQEVAENGRGKVVDLGTSGPGRFAIRSADGSRLRFFGMGSTEEPIVLAGEIQFDLAIVGADTDAAGRLLVKLDSGPGAGGAVDLAVASLPTDEWRTVTVQVSDIVHNASDTERPLDLARVRSLFVLEPTAAIRARIDNVRIRCAHSKPAGCGIAPPAEAGG